MKGVNKLLTSNKGMTYKDLRKVIRITLLCIKDQDIRGALVNYPDKPEISLEQMLKRTLRRKVCI